MVSMNAVATLFGLGGTNWKEEVLLQDGKIIIAERSYKLGGYPVIESREQSALDETVTFSLPGTAKKIIWKTDFRDTVPEPNSLNLLLFDVIRGVPYIATYPAGCIAYNKWQRPNPPYILFKYENDEWRRISLAEFPPELSKSNVIVGRPATSLLKPFYTVDQVNKQNYDIHTPEYKNILREPLANAGNDCGEMVYDGHGGWTGLGWFKRQSSREACLKYCEREKIGARYCPCGAIFPGGN
jgi:hypothetical protein